MAGTLIVSLDFELFWGMQDCCTLESYEDHVLGGRKAIGRLLELFQKHGIHATWATVGFQFAENYAELKEFFPEKAMLPTYENEEVSTYGCFEKIGGDEQAAPCFYGGSLLKQIASVPGQEIGSHTFSHYYCREAGQTAEQFRADMMAAQRIARAKGYEVKSVVFPRNQSNPEHIDVLRQLGYTAYREEENDWIHHLKIVVFKRAFTLLDAYVPLSRGGFVPENENGIVNVVGSKMYRPYFKPLGFMERVKLARIKGQIRSAAKKGQCYHLWWHPHNVGVMTEYHLAQLEEIFGYYDKMKEKYGMRSRNMGEVAQEVLGK